MPDLNELFQNEQVKKMMRDQTTVERLKNAPESQRLLELLSQQANGNPESMVDAAARGEPQQLMGAIQKMLHDPESRKLLDEISQSIQL